MTADLSKLPENLPIPIDDGACRHLPGCKLPCHELPTSSGGRVDLSRQSGLTVIYLFPMIGDPSQALPEAWDTIPGARGCTPQSCSFRDEIVPLRQLADRVYGLSSQHVPALRAAVNRLGLPYDLLSDADLAFTRALRLPTFDTDGRTFIKRITLICRDGFIEKVFYPVFPPDQNAQQVIEYLSQIN